MVKYGHTIEKRGKIVSLVDIGTRGEWLVVL